MLQLRLLGHIFRIPMTWKRHGGRKVIIAPNGGDAWAPAKPRPDETLIRALARAHRWKRRLEEGICRSAGEVAESEKVTRTAEGNGAGGSDTRDAERVGGTRRGLSTQ